MLFNSIEFAIFLPIVFCLYWLAIRRLVLQNSLIVIASFIFYGWWDWRFLSLLIFSASVDYFVGLALSRQSDTKKRQLLLALSIFVNLGLLGFFKYYNFFVESFADAFTFFGRPFEHSSLRIVLPVGISFYTFQALSYSIDVYKKKLEPTKDIIAYFAFISFFPQLVAGPIERATQLLPQFYSYRTFDSVKAIDGLRQMLWGFFKKVVIADNCAEYVNNIFDNYAEYPGSTLLVGIFFFAFQIYCDFSGYSDIAIGTARLFGFSLMRNFAFPYFSRDIAEFWRRWHISLTTWFRDYVYIPLGGSQGGIKTKVRNTFIIFLLSGFWHGANWTFIVWGLLNAIYFLPLLLANKNRNHTDIVAIGKVFPSPLEFFQMIFTFFITLIAWVFFRAQNLSQAFAYLGKMFSPSIFSTPHIVPNPLPTFMFIFTMCIAEWLQRERQHALDFGNTKVPKLIRWGIYYTIVLLILHFSGKQQDFIYFQF